MKFSTRTGNPASFKTECLVAAPERALAVARALDMEAFVRRALDQAPERTPAVIALPAAVQTMIVPPVAAAPLREAQFRRSARDAAAALARLPAKSAVWCLNDLTVEDGAGGARDAGWKARAAMAAMSDAIYDYSTHKSARKRAKRRGASSVSLLVGRGERNAVVAAAQHGNAIDAGMRFARDLGNAPPNVCNPAWLAGAAETLAEECANVTCEVLDEAALEALGMSAFLAVTRGSAAPAKLVVLRYNGAEADRAPVVHIGKGVTFDTGGISLKPVAAMDEMKFDMCGAAGVAGALKAAAIAKLPVNLVTVLAAAENMPGGNATRPGDIVKTLSGQTVEILNTDAEGRLLLCDAITFARRFKPAAVVDVATLTGACVVALGAHASAVFANDDALRDELVAAGEFSGDRAWPMPLWDDYQAQLKSNFADMANIGGRPAGAITAACFLARFAKGLKWAHLDVAGTAYRSGARKGATGRPVPLLFEHLLQRAAP